MCKIDSLKSLTGVAEKIRRNPVRSDYWEKENRLIKELKKESENTKDILRISEFDFGFKFFKISYKHF